MNQKGWLLTRLVIAVQLTVILQAEPVPSNQGLYRETISKYLGLNNEKVSLSHPIFSEQINKDSLEALGKKKGQCIGVLTLSLSVKAPVYRPCSANSSCSKEDL